MEDRLFDPKKLNKLNNPERLKDIPPEFIWDKLKISNPKLMIDIGAGTGFFSIPFSDYYQNGKIIACDISTIMIDWMKENVCPTYTNISALKMNENSIPVENNMADFVLMLNLHHELSNPEIMLAESYRVLNNGGKIAISDWKKEEMPYGPPLHIRCDTKDIIKELENIGFNTIETYNELPKNFLIIAEK